MIKVKLVIVIAILLVGGLFSAWLARSNSSTLPAERVLTDAQIIDRVKSLRDLEPEEDVEVVFIHSIKDDEKSSYSVFKEAEKGDYVVVLKDSSRVLLYSPDENSIIRDDPLLQSEGVDNAS